MISISCRVSVFSETKLMGTTISSSTPEERSFLIVSSVGGESHSIGPTRLW